MDSDVSLANGLSHDGPLGAGGKREPGSDAVGALIYRFAGISHGYFVGDERGTSQGEEQRCTMEMMVWRGMEWMPRVCG